MPHLNPQTAAFCAMLQMENHINPAGRPPWTPPPTPPEPQPQTAAPSTSIDATDMAQFEEILKAGDVDLEHMSAKDFLARFAQAKKTAPSTTAPAPAAEANTEASVAQEEGAADQAKLTAPAPAAAEETGGEGDATEDVPTEQQQA